MADGDVSCYTAGSLSRAAEARNTTERTANSHNDIEIVAVHNRQVGHRHAAQGACGVCFGVAATRGLCEYDRIASGAPRKPSVVFPVAPIAHCHLDLITSIRRLRGRNNIDFGETRHLARYLSRSQYRELVAVRLRIRSLQSGERGVN